MPSPANDLQAGAITIAGASGSIQGTTLGATNDSAAGFTIPKGVWYSWTAPQTDVYRFGVRRRGQYGNVTNFPANVWIIGSLSGQGKRYAGWWDQGEFTFSLSGGAQYYILVGSLTGVGGPNNDGSGDFLLWWEPAGAGIADIYPERCSEPNFPLAYKGYGVVGAGVAGFQYPVELVACFSLDVTQKNYMNFPTFTRGWYFVDYSGGAWNYRDGWVIQKVPPSVPQSWFDDNPTGSFVWVDGVAGWPVDKIAFDSETTPPGAGYATAEQAQAAQNYCTGVVFFHAGGTVGRPLRLGFSDNQYFDNSVSATIGTARWRVLRINPAAITPLYATLSRSSAGHYSGLFYVMNSSGFDLPGNAFSPWSSAFVSGANVTSSTTGIPGNAGSNTYGAILNSQATSFPISFVISPTSKLDVAAVLNVLSSSYPFAEVNFDLTPQPKVIAIGSPAITKSAGRWLVTFEFSSGAISGNSGLPTIALHATFEEMGGISDIRNANTNTPQLDFLVDDGLGSRAQANLSFISDGSGAATFTIHLHDNTANLDFPPVVITLSCPG